MALDFRRWKAVRNRDHFFDVPGIAAHYAGLQVPSRQTVEANVYQPLARPLFLYVSKKSMERPEIKEFVNFYLQNVGEMAGAVGYVSLPSKVYALATERFNGGTTGSIFAGKGSQVGVSLEEALSGSKSPG